MDFAVSSAVAITPPPALFSSQTSAASPPPPPHPPPSADVSSQRASQLSPAAHSPALLPAPTEMDLSTSVPSLPSLFALDHEDSVMADAEPLPNGSLTHGNSSGAAEDSQALSSSFSSSLPPVHGEQAGLGQLPPEQPIANTPAVVAPPDPADGHDASEAATLNQTGGSELNPEATTDARSPAVDLGQPAAPAVNGSAVASADIMDMGVDEAQTQPPLHDSQGNPAPQVEEAANAPAPETQPSPAPVSHQDAPTPPAPEVSFEGDDLVNADDIDDSDTSSDFNDDASARADFQEDTSAPDAEELKEIESSSERNATDHEALEKMFFFDLEDPEYIPAEVGRIEWVATGVRGTMSHPNKEALVKSPAVRIGELDWTIKFYPRGNQTDHVSVYLEASKPKPQSEPAPSESAGASTSNSNPATVVPSSPSPEASGAEHDPNQQSVPDSSLVPSSSTDHPSLLPPPPPPPPPSAPSDAPPPPPPTESRPDDVSSAGTSTTVAQASSTEDWSVAAQFGIIMYNPSEPRVHCGQSMQHRFRPSSPDWGSTRFGVPYRQLHKRQKGQRQAMLRNDTLAFTAYIRIIKDDTQTLWVHEPLGPGWDSLAKTGLRALATKSSEGSSIASAVASWMLLAPFRDIIYSVPTTHPLKERKSRPKPVVIALQRILSRMQAQQKPSTSPVSLEPLTDILAIGSASSAVNDVAEFWMLLRRRLDEELRDTPMARKLEDLFDGSIRRAVTAQAEGSEASREEIEMPISAGKPSKLRLPVKGMKSIQTAFAHFMGEHDGQGRATLHNPPKLLQVELDRQLFDQSSRKWKKVVDHIQLDETLDLTPWASSSDTPAQYTLYGLVVHTNLLRSNRYHVVLRPGGPGTRWYMYSPVTETVVCRTRKQAIDENQGVPAGQEGDGSETVAYIAMYVRNDAIGEVLQGLPEQPQAPQWIRDELELEAACADAPFEELRKMYADKPIDVRIYRPTLFENYAGPGIFDLYGVDNSTLQSAEILDFTSPGSAKMRHIQKRVAAVIGVRGDSKRCQLFRFNALSGIQARTSMSPALKWHDSTTVAAEKLEWSPMQYWLHVLPDLPNEEGPKPGPWPLSTSADSAPSSAGSPRLDAQDSAAPDRKDEREVDDQANEPGATQDEEMVDAADEIPMTHVANDGAGEPMHDAMEVDATGTVASDAPAAPGSEQTQQPAQTSSSSNTDAPPQQEQQEQPQQQAQPAPVKTSTLLRDGVIFFLKWFDAKEQSLVGVDSFLAKLDDNVLVSIRATLGLEDSYAIRVSEELHAAQVRAIGQGRTFKEEGLGHGAILVVEEALSDAEACKLEEQGKFPSLSAYLESCIDRLRFLLPADDVVDSKPFSGSAYTGSRKYGKYHGQGTLIELNGDAYDGNFVLGKRQGHGRMQFHNGDVYTGVWKAGRMHEHGTLVYARTGNTYVGGFQDGRRHGRGRMEYVMAEDDLRLCQICYEEDMDCLFYDCGHVCACMRCAKQLEDCPLCRKAVISVVKMYWT